MHHARGELLISLGDSVLAEQSLQRAIAVARSQTQSYTRSTPPPASRPGGLEIDNQLELNWGLDGKLARFCALEDAIGVGRCFPIRIELVNSVGQQPADFSEDSARIDGR
jgi:hypothetical protein